MLWVGAVLGAEYQLLISWCETLLDQQQVLVLVLEEPLHCHEFYSRAITMITN